MTLLKKTKIKKTHIYKYKTRFT